ncbi:hypothetical protein Tco_0721436, partial [Tanacetum coccineum]
RSGGGCGTCARVRVWCRVVAVVVAVVEDVAVVVDVAGCGGDVEEGVFFF